MDDEDVVAAAGLEVPPSVSSQPYENSYEQEADNDSMTNDEDDSDDDDDDNDDDDDGEEGSDNPDAGAAPSKKQRRV